MKAPKFNPAEADAIRQLMKAGAVSPETAVPVLSLGASANAVNRLNGRGMLGKAEGKVFLNDDGLAGAAQLEKTEEGSL